MNIAALIPARLGSKRLPKKNIKPLGGKPLLFWSIDFALKCRIFRQICVSTESDEIAEIVRKQYAPSEVAVLMRPQELATDEASLNDVCIHFLNNSQKVDFLSLLMPTYPFRNSERFRSEIIPALLSRQVDRVISVRYGNYSSFDYWIPAGKKFLRMFTKVPLWCGAGNATYSIQKREYFFLPPHCWPYHIGERTLRIQTDYRESVDIDTPEDFAIAQKLLAGSLPQMRELTVKSNDLIELVAPVGINFESFLEFLESKKINIEEPVLILRPADPAFTFLRLYECNSSKDYTSNFTKKIIATLPESGHSQDFPLHYLHSPIYRILRKKHDQNGMLEKSVPKSQIIFEETMKREWKDYLDTYYWS